MKILLHVGIPKTGTTSLQRGLWEIRDDLLKEGYYYPECPGRPLFAHHIFLSFFEHENVLTSYHLENFGSLENQQLYAKKYLLDIKAKAKKNRCHTVILSSELLFPGHGQKDFEKLCFHLRELSDDIEAVVYVREAASLYKSRLQQNAKKGEFLIPFRRGPLREGLEKIEKELKKKPIVRAFEKNRLSGGDILQDFCSKVLNLKGFESKLPTVRANTSISAEATAALLIYGDVSASLNDDSTSSHKKIIRRCISTFDDSEKYLTPLNLKPEVIDDVRKSAFEFIWLRDTYGIEFGELDYSEIEADGSRLKKYDSPEKVFEYDQEKLSWLLFRVLHNSQFARTNRPKRK